MYAAYVGSPVRNWPKVYVFKLEKKWTSDAEATDAIAPPSECPVTIGLYSGKDNSCACIAHRTSLETEFLSMSAQNTHVGGRKCLPGSQCTIVDLCRHRQ